MSYLPEKKRNLTEKQEAFLNNLVETGGDFKKSAELAGYSGNHYQILLIILYNPHNLLYNNIALFVL